VFVVFLFVLLRFTATARKNIVHRFEDFPVGLWSHRFHLA